MVMRVTCERHVDGWDVLGIEGTMKARVVKV